MKPIEMNLNDHLLKRQLQDQIDAAFKTGDIRLMKEVAEMLANSYVQSRVAAKWLAQDMAQNLGTMRMNNPPEM